MRVYNDALPKNILRGKVPTATLWDGQIGFAYQAKTGGTVFTDFSAAANNATANDVTFFDATMQAQDAFYFGENFSTSGPFNSLLINVGTAANVAATLTWEYWNGAWVALTVVDGTTALTTTGSNYVTWTIPGDMTHTTVNAQDRYWVRLRVSAFTSKTTAPLGTQIWLGRYPTSLANTTDGDVTTSSGQASVLMGAAAQMGLIEYDLGTSKTVLVGGYSGIWSSASNVSILIEAFPTTGSYPTTTTVGTTVYQIATATEIKVTFLAKIVTGRYIVLRYVNATAASAYMNLYDVKAYEVGK